MAYTLFINPPHPFSIVLSRFWYFTQDLLRTIEPLENNRKWMWYVYKQHNNLVVGLVFEIQDLALRARSWISIQDLPLGYYPIYNPYLYLHLQFFLIIFLTINPNPPCQLSLWEETGEPRENPRLSAECDQMLDTGIEPIRWATKAHVNISTLGFVNVKLTLEFDSLQIKIKIKNR